MLPLNITAWVAEKVIQSGLSPSHWRTLALALKLHQCKTIHSMRKLLICLFLANVILTLISLLILPSEVAIHFVRNGIPDSWAPRETNAIIFLVIQLPLFILFYSASILPLKIPPKLLSLPNKNYWLKEENISRIKPKLTSLMLEFGCALFCFLLGTGLLTLEANLADPVRLNETLFFPLFIAFMLYTGYWCVKFAMAFKIPEDTKGTKQETTLHSTE